MREETYGAGSEVKKYFHLVGSSGLSNGFNRGKGMRGKR